MILDLFAGPGGWDEGLRTIGITDVVGLEWDAAACATRAAAGHLTVRTDVATYPTEPFVGRVRGLIASPPCQAFSMAGKGAGRAEIDHIHRAVEACRTGWVAPDREWLDPRTPLILEPLRWAWALRPRWVACEQVPPALPVWEHMVDVLRSWGYAADCRVLCAADYGVPQTRNRAFLIATTGKLAWPEPTHAEKPVADLFGPARKPWVTMAQALGWGAEWEFRGSNQEHSAKRANWVGRVRTSFGEPHRGKGVGSPKPEFDPHEVPSRTICSKTGDWRLNPGVTDTQPNRRLYGPGEPAPTIGFGHDAANWKWVLDRRQDGAPTLDPQEVPCPTIPGEALAKGVWIMRPEHTVERAKGSAYVKGQDYSEAVRITVAEAAILQGFARPYPWQGTKSKQFEQVGNVVCPPVAAAIVGALDPALAAAEEAA